MKRLLTILIISLFLVTMCYLPTFAKTIDPAQDHIEEIKELGYDLSQLPTEEEILENGDIKIWHCIYEEDFKTGIDPFYQTPYIIVFYDLDHNIDEKTGLPFNPNDDVLIDGLRYYYSIKPGGKSYNNLSGDINQDNSLDMKDVLLLRKHLVNPELFVVNMCDLNNDFVVDMKDLFILRQRIILAYGIN